MRQCAIRARPQAANALEGVKIIVSCFFPRIYKYFFLIDIQMSRESRTTRRYAVWTEHNTLLRSEKTVGRWRRVGKENEKQNFLRAANERRRRRAECFH